MELVGREKICSVKGCENKAFKAISVYEFSRIGVNFPSDIESKDRTIYLCKEHYKVYKRITKKHRKLEKYRRGMGYI